MKSHNLNRLKIICLLLVLLLIPTLLLNTTASAQTTETYPFVDDDANLLTENEIDELYLHVKDIMKKNKIDIYLVTTNSLGGLSSNDYRCDYVTDVDSLQVTNTTDCVILLISMDNREVSISGYGKCEEKINDGKINKIIKHITPALSSGNYATAFTNAVDDINKYMNKDALPFQVWFQLIIAVVLALIIVSILAHHSEGKITTNAATYLDAGQSTIPRSHDRYIRTVVTKHKKPESSSGGGTKSGSGSRSHSSGSGHF